MNRRCMMHALRFAGLLAGSIVAYPSLAEAADAQHSHAPRTDGVVMLIGGMRANTDVVEAHGLESASASASAALDAPPSISVVIQRDGTLPTDSTRRSSNAIAARILAFAPAIDEAAALADVDRALLMAVIDVESAGNPQAVSPKGATGLMQLMPGTGARHGANDLFNPRQNIAAGARYLKALIGQFGDLELALAAYNAGEGAVQKYGGQIPPYAETMSYVPKVMARYRWYRNATASPSAASIDASSDANASATLRISAVTVPISRPRAAASN
ncbi:lytic transglycosylase domain-containing protein [Paraburkholderia sp. D15]|uniref:lytic transglycosylase domain-containing protein n=1 Tax=Paraburkholderia sp. D15 TaxID=2880218 RepID=UPI00247A6E2D|nr:lytic transglycosylase domain-containing protein [Paraburkholderia sp. D15]WGS54606.1 lytic transglycosylase domain-containing protein [Paraburkholderia sp. D15]